MYTINERINSRGADNLLYVARPAQPNRNTTRLRNPRPLPEDYIREDGRLTHHRDIKRYYANWAPSAPHIDIHMAERHQSISCQIV